MNDYYMIDKLVNDDVFVIKTSDYNTIMNINGNNNIVTIKRLNRFINRIHVDQLVFIIFGGDKQKSNVIWETGFTAIATVFSNPKDDYNGNFEIDVKIILKFGPIKKSEYISYTEVFDTGIGPMTKGEANQAINKIENKKALNIIIVTLAIKPQLQMQTLRIFNVKDVIELKNMYSQKEMKSSNTLESDEFYDDLEPDNFVVEETTDFVENDELAFEGEEDVIDFVQEKRSDDSQNFNKNSIINRLFNSSSSDTKQLLNISRESYTLFELYRKYKRFELGETEASVILAPSFQRKDVWKKRKKEELIESILMGIPLPSFYLYEDERSNLVVVDGKQRLTSIFDFLNNTLSLNGKIYSHDKKNIYFKDLKSVIQRKFEDYQIICFLISRSTAIVIRNEIFTRVNRGGVPLNSQEIRNAIFVGQSTKLLNKISDDEEINIINEKTRAKDQYLALRFFGYYLVLFDKKFHEKYDVYSDYIDIDTFLEEIMRYINMMNDSEIEELYSAFKKSYVNSKASIENKLLYRKKDSSKLNMILFETWMIYMSNKEISEILENSDKYKDSYENLITNEDFLDNISFHRDMKDKFLWRLKFIENYIKEVNNLD